MSEAYVLVKNRWSNGSIDIVQSTKPTNTDYLRAKSGSFERVREGKYEWSNESLSKDDRVYVVIVKYTTGNTFGRDPDPRMAIACICTDEESADVAQEMLKNTFVYKRNPKPEKPSWDTEGFGYAEWDGYFEDVSEIYIERHVVWE